MFDILLSLCLTGGDVCADRLLPASYATEAACTQAAPDRAAAWAASGTDDRIRLVSQRCIAWADLPGSVPPLEVVEIAPGIFVHEGQIAEPNAANAGDTANLGFVIGQDAVAVIDAGSAHGVAERLYAAIRARTALPVTTLFLTHMHPDHAMGAGFFRAAGARIVGHPNLELALANRAGSYTTALGRLLGAEAYLGTRLVGPDTALPRHEIDLGGRILIAEAQPLAHTETDLTVFDPATGTLFVGDLVFAGHIPALDGSILGWQGLLDQMAERTIQRIVPGHGPPALPWPMGADATRAYLAAITTEARRAIAEGAPMSRATRQIGESQRAAWQLFDAFNRRNATAAYKELEWE